MDDPGFVNPFFSFSSIQFRSVFLLRSQVNTIFFQLQEHTKRIKSGKNLLAEVALLAASSVRKSQRTKKRWIFSKKNITDLQLKNTVCISRIEKNVCSPFTHFDTLRCHDCHRPSELTFCIES